MTISKTRIPFALTLLAALTTMSACSIFNRQSERECMERAMYFESNRSSRDGMIAVGTVVMNRVKSSKFPNTVCEVVGQKNQFAPGIMRRKMTDSGLPLTREAATAVMRGERHPLIQNAMFFHQAGYSFPYDNMHYEVVAGGNAFYDKRNSSLVTKPVPPAPTEGLTRAR